MSARRAKRKRAEGIGKGRKGQQGERAKGGASVGAPERRERKRETAGLLVANGRELLVRGRWGNFGDWTGAPGGGGKGGRDWGTRGHLGGDHTE